ncbi:MAG: hypothetical protein Q9176_003550, partial [Flavoplaca citrina]
AIYQQANNRETKTQPLIQHTSSASEPLSMEWPIIDEALEKEMSNQLHTSISIYGNGGVFEDFEIEFKNYHDANCSYTLLHNSGTNALHALYFAAGLSPGDEVIFPVYTFHATCSPAMQFGIKPIFCDANKNGTVSPSAIANAITTKTKAVVKGQHVGTFGNGAAWSLQGQKTVTGGEGGIALTKHAEFHYRMLIFGHYHKRCKLEIRSDHYLHQYALTGAGLKNRAHPLAVAIALNQLRQLPDFHAWKTTFAGHLAEGLAGTPFLTITLPDLTGGTEPAWYAFTMRFIADKAPPGLTRETFVQQLYTKGLIDVDIPRSTGLLHSERLFNKPQELLLHLYGKDYVLEIDDKAFPEAQAFFDEVIKLPVYATAHGQGSTDRYVTTIMEVAASRMEN